MPGFLRLPLSVASVSSVVKPPRNSPQKTARRPLAKFAHR
jgi:hypothetical protein